MRRGMDETHKLTGNGHLLWDATMSDNLGPIKNQPRSGFQIRIYFFDFWSTPGLPDFFRHNIPKRGKIHQITTTLPNCHKMYQMTEKYSKWPNNIPNDHTIFQMTIQYTSIFHSKALQNLPKLGFLVWKQTIWQPWISPHRDDESADCVFGSANRVTRLDELCPWGHCLLPALFWITEVAHILGYFFHG
jgi:hypothetical protein